MPRGDRGLSAGSPAADEALGEVLEHSMLCRPDWKRTRQACGVSGVANPALPQEGGGLEMESPSQAAGAVLGQGGQCRAVAGAGQEGVVGTGGEGGDGDGQMDR